MTDLRSIEVGAAVDPAAAYESLFAARRNSFWLRNPGGMNYLGTGTRVPGATGPAPLRSELDRLNDGADSDGRRDLGLVGWLGYEFGHEPPASDGRERTSAFIRVRHSVAIDEDGTARLLYRGGTREAQSEAVALATALRERLDDAPTRNPGESPCDSPSELREWPSAPIVHRHDSDADYLAKIRRCQQAIVAGDAYLLCLTTRITVHADRSPLRTFARLLALNGTERSGLVTIDGTSLISSSPEQFLSIASDRTITTSPIKGTRSRSRDPVEDAALADELAHSEKERAENTMIVDLMRNDLTRVCDLGSVSVSKHCVVESFAQVHQLVSTVTGRLRPGLDAVTALESCFPAGSMTGAPKSRAQELLREIEGRTRGAYAGAFGWFGFDGTAELSMTIRTILYADGVATIGTGGGITALSIPEEEVAEMHLKARAPLLALTSRDKPPGRRPPSGGRSRRALPTW